MILLSRVISYENIYFVKHDDINAKKMLHEGKSAFFELKYELDKKIDKLK